jgi:hypothetical protein
MDKLTYTAVEKKGDNFATFRFGGYNLTTGKTLAQSLIDNASSDKALAGGLYTTCAALVDIARERGYLLSSAVVACIASEDIRNSADAVARAADKLATLRKHLARAKREANRLAYLPIKGLGGNADEQTAREKALSVALLSIRASIAAINGDIETASADYRAAVDNLHNAERHYYEANAKKNAEKNNNNNNDNNNNNN